MVNGLFGMNMRDDADELSTDLNAAGPPAACRPSGMTVPTLTLGLCCVELGPDRAGSSCGRFHVQMVRASSVNVAATRRCG
jgi:hypothetical protein